jgi:hypothetical protein
MDRRSLCSSRCLPLAPHRRRLAGALCTWVLVGGCAADEQSDAASDSGASVGTSLGTTTLTTTASASESGTAPTSASGSGSESGSSSDTTSASASSASTTAPSTGASASGSSGGPKFDVNAATASEGTAASDTMSMGGGCEKVDFLFVIDSSGSMEDEQGNLIAAFPAFIQTIQQELQAQDYHLMVVDTDAGAAGSTTITCSPDPQCCQNNCAVFGAGAVCNGRPCVPSNEPCDDVLAAGKNDDLNGNPCNFSSGTRFVTDAEANLVGAFECAGRVGIAGSGAEKTMQSMVEAVTVQNGAGQCNAGFLRDDAILVVTFITDEHDDDTSSESTGDPATWKSALVTAKNGDENAVVVLGLIGDLDQPSPVCTEDLTQTGGVDGAEASPRLRQFAESFVYGQWGSVCSPSYDVFFEQAVGVIDTACDEFVPPG